MSTVPGVHSLTMSELPNPIKPFSLLDASNTNFKVLKFRNKNIQLYMATTKRSTAGALVSIIACLCLYLLSRHTYQKLVSCSGKFIKSFKNYQAFFFFISSHNSAPPMYSTITYSTDLPWADHNGIAMQYQIPGPPHTDLIGKSHLAYTYIAQTTSLL